jgi:membrane protein implicated in regulation of membrane protease activity
VLQAREPGLLAKVLAALAAAILLVLGFMFSLVILALAVVAGLAAWGWFWWKTRELRKTMPQHPVDGHVIEGEAIVVDEYPSARGVDRIEAADKPE